MHNGRLIIIPRDLPADGYDTDDAGSMVYTNELSEQEVIKREIISLSRILAIFWALEEIQPHTNHSINTLVAKFAFMDSVIEKQLKLLDQIPSTKYGVDLGMFKINLRNDIEENRKYFMEIDYVSIENTYINESLFIIHRAFESQLLAFDLQAIRGMVNANFIRFKNIIKAIESALPAVDDEISEDEDEEKTEEPVEIEEYLLEILAEFFNQVALLRLAKLNKLTYKI